MEPINNPQLNQFHQEVDAYLNSAEKGELTEEQLFHFKALIAHTPMEVTDTEKERLFAIHQHNDPSNPTTTKMSALFGEIIDIVKAQIPEKQEVMFSNLPFMERLMHYLPAKETVQLADVSKDMRVFTDKGRVELMNSNPDHDLESLGFSDLPSLQNFLLRNGKNLTSLNVREFNISNDDLQAIIEACPNLIKLSISSERLDDQGVEKITDQLKNLTVLDLSGCFLITDTGAKTIATNLKRLKELDLSRCDQISDTGVTAIATEMKQLIKLHLNRCDLVTDEGVGAIAHGMNKLRSLDLSGCWRISDTGVVGIAYGLKELELLNLRNCEKITNEAAITIGNEMPQLKTLDVGLCKGISKATIKQLHREHPSIDIVR